MFLYLYLYFLFFACNSAFEQGHLEPWRYINAFIILFLFLRNRINSTCMLFLSMYTFHDIDNAFMCTA